MNRVSLLLLVTLVQSKSDGILLPNPDNASDSFEDSLQDLQVEDWDNAESVFPKDLMADYSQVSEGSQKRSTGDAFTRRSALDKNFMRFGRTPRPAPHQLCGHFRVGASDGKPSFFRFGRGLKDNFIRFGRGGKDSFIRFGRTRPEDFFRAGKSMRDNFIRFGKADKNFMRFGRKEAEKEYPDSPEEFLRFTKNGNQKEGRNGTNFLRFGKKDKEEGDLEGGSERRKRREVGRSWKGGEGLEDKGRGGGWSGGAKAQKRSTGFFQDLPENFPRRLSPLLVSNSWQTLENLRNSRLTPFFPVTSNFPRTSFFSGAEPGSEAKRNQGGGSNFIRFG